jgi:hypothetical protein
LAVVLLGTLLSACANEEKNDAVVRAALRRTERLSRRFSYTDESANQILLVQGVIDDDFRHAERLLINDKPAMDQVTYDDALALRFLEPELVPRFVGGNGGNLDVPGGPKDVPVYDVLATRRWVVDQAGAPSLLGRRVRNTGADPVYDARVALKYVATAMDDADFVRVFNPEALDYKPAEDPFPHPKSGIKRYDFQRPPLPRAGVGSGGSNQAVPDIYHFRRMAVYIKDGQIVEVREAIDVETRLRELARVYGVTFPDRPRAELAGIAVDAINALRTGQGNDPIRVRAMVLRFAEVGQPQKVDLPGDALVGTLDLRSKELDGRDGSGATTGSTGSSTTTTAPPGG